MLLTDISRRGRDGNTSQHQTASAVLVQAVQDILHTGFYIVHVTVGQHTVLVHQLEGKKSLEFRRFTAMSDSKRQSLSMIVIEIQPSLRIILWFNDSKIVQKSYSIFCFNIM